MGHAHYLVAEQKAGWFITFEGERWGPITGGRIAALVAAVQAAHQAGKDGHDSNVRLSATGEDIQTVWSFGRDPYPPPWVEQLRLGANPRKRGAKRGVTVGVPKPA